jgi:thioredoxin reductase
MPGGSFDYTIFATGREPDLNCLSKELINKQVQLEQLGLLYVIGDVKNGMLRQSSVAIGDGIRAAMAIKDRISNESDQ